MFRIYDKANPNPAIQPQLKAIGSKLDGNCTTFVVE